jgi:hypothetical protein
MTDSPTPPPLKVGLEPAAEASPAAAGGPAWCSSLWGHRFVARYSYRPPARVKGEAELAADFARAMTIRTYECDVCVRCGVVVKRP